MSDKTQQPIVIKRIKKGGGGHHGGAWKIAYADFVTAMMAFFLLLWLLGSTSEEDLRGIAEGFDMEMKVAMMGGSSVGEQEISSVLPAGGEDLTKSVGQVRRGTSPGREKPRTDDASLRAQGGQSDSGVQGKDRSGEGTGEGEGTGGVDRSAERAQLLDLKGRIEAVVEASPELRPYKDQLLVQITAEGLRIQIVDEKNRPMFSSGSAEVQPHMRSLLRAIGRALNGVPNKISVSGHTDSTPFVGGLRGFSNWELSADRANASRRELVQGGLDPSKVLRVVGLADIAPLVPEDPAAPVNRRISLLVLNKQAEEDMRRESFGALEAPPEDSEAAREMEMRARGYTATDAAM